MRVRSRERPAVFDQRPDKIDGGRLDYDFIQVEYEAVRHAITKRNWDFWTIISGPPGVGKSTLAIMLATITQPDWEPSVGAHYDTASFIEALIEHERASTEVYDEAIQGASGKDAMTTDYRALEATGEIVRGLNHHAIMCIPRFWGFGPYWRNTRADTWIHVERRGRARVHIPSQNLYSKDDTFWNYVCTVEYPTLEGTAIWQSYEQAKHAYLKPAIKRRLDDVRAKTQPENDDHESRSDHLRHLAEEVAHNSEAWGERGRVDVGYLIRTYNLKDYEARSVARTAKALKGA